MASTISVEFCGEWYRVEDGEELTIGREADLTIDEDNPFLHRRFLTIVQVESMWWLVNIGARLSATITDGTGSMQAWLAPGARIPLVFDVTKVVFTAGPTTYDLSVHAESPEFARIAGPDDPAGETTVGSVQLTPSRSRSGRWRRCCRSADRPGSGRSSGPGSARRSRRVRHRGPGPGGSARRAARPRCAAGRRGTGRSRRRRRSRSRPRSPPDRSAGPRACAA